MVRLGMALNRDTWNAVSFVSRKKNDRENSGREQYSNSIPGSKPGRRQPRPGLSFWGFSDCTLKKL